MGTAHGAAWGELRCDLRGGVITVRKTFILLGDSNGLCRVQPERGAILKRRAGKRKKR